MMFASDLDRTLIYSKRAMEDYPTDEIIDLVPVEQKLNQEVSFMSKNSLNHLQNLSTKLLFVPVTTRSLDQYERVFFKETAIKYAVTTNGANIHYNGKPLAEWDIKVTKEMEALSVKLGELIPFIKQHAHIKGELRIVEDLFIYYYLTEMVTPEIIEELMVILEEKGWRVSLQGKKLYFMPIAISKGKAIKFIQEREGVTTLIGAGDSLFDDDFLQYCQHPFVLGHGELATYPLKEHYNVIKQIGIKGGEELLKSITQLVEKQG